MKEIYNMILKEKAKDCPNKDYIQFLQQMTDKPPKEYFIDEIKRQNMEKEIYKSNTQEVEDFFKNSGGFQAIGAAIQFVVKGFQLMISYMPQIIGLMVAMKVASLGLAAAQAALAISKSAALTAAGFGFGAAIVAGVIASMTVAAMNNIPKAQTGRNMQEGGLVQALESGPEIFNVPAGTSIMGAEQTRQTLNGGGFGKIENALERLVSLQHVNNEGQRNMKLTAGRGTLEVGLDSNLGGSSITMG